MKLASDGRVLTDTQDTWHLSGCRFCGADYGTVRLTPNGPECPVTTCLACGIPQCLTNGLGRGQCSHCYHGLLPGWQPSGQVCRYKGCGLPAVARGRGNGLICTGHLSRQTKVGQSVIAAMAAYKKLLVAA